jgi:hypothetical protein
MYRGKFRKEGVVLKKGIEISNLGIVYQKNIVLIIAIQYNINCTVLYDFVQCEWKAPLNLIE